MAFLRNTLVLHKKKIYNDSRRNKYLTLGITNPLPGFDIGIPLTIFESTYTYLHYGENILNFKLILIEFLLGYYAYGRDRYNDAIQFERYPSQNTYKDVYTYILNNKSFVYQSLNICYFSILFILLNDEKFIYNIPFILLLQSLDSYKQFKPLLGPLKPVYIGSMWTIASIILPCVLYEHNYSILLSPLDYIPCTLTLFGASNIIDNEDIIDDSNNKINTLPVLIGLDNSIYISLLALILSSLMIGLNPSYLDNSLGNSYLELQNGIISLLPLFLNQTNINY